MNDPWLAAELASARSPADLVTVDAGAAMAVADRLRRMAATLGAAEQEMRSLASVPDWKGEAGRAFERRAAGMPDHARDGGMVFEAASRAMTELARVASGTRARMARAFDMWQTAEHTSARWHDAVEQGAAGGGHVVGLPLEDPGRAVAEQAVRLYAEAREETTESVWSALDTLTHAANAAPGVGSLFPSTSESVGGLLRGGWDVVSGTTRFVWDFSPMRAATDFDGFRADVDDLRRGVEYLAENPDELDDVLLDLDTLRTDPDRWVGRFLTAYVLTAPISAGASVPSAAVARMTTRLGKPGRWVTRHMDQLESAAPLLGLPSPTMLLTLDPASLRRNVLDASRRLPAPPGDDLTRLASEHGGRVEDYEPRIASIELDGECLTVEFVHNTVTDEIFQPRLVVGGPPDDCS